MPLHRIIGLLALLVVFGLAGCARVAPPPDASPGDCLRRDQARIEELPFWDCLPTLDGQCVPLSPFFEACSALWPDCVLYAKFYHWDSEIAQIVSTTPRGPVSHRIRMYHNILHACDPDYQDDQRTHGDVAEFYDAAGNFMGLAVYMGQGVYCPLPANDRGWRP